MHNDLHLPFRDTAACIYELIGYHPDTVRCYESRRAVRASTRRLADELVRSLQHATVSAAFDLDSSQLTVAPGFSVWIFVRCQRLSTGALRWPVRRRIDRGSSMVLVVRMQQDNTFVLDYHLIPRERLPRGNITFRRTAKEKLDRYRQTSLNAVVDVILREVDDMWEAAGWLGMTSSWKRTTVTTIRTSRKRPRKRSEESADKTSTCRVLFAHRGRQICP